MSTSKIGTYVGTNIYMKTWKLFASVASYPYGVEIDNQLTRVRMYVLTLYIFLRVPQ